MAVKAAHRTCHFCLDLLINTILWTSLEINCVRTRGNFAQDPAAESENLRKWHDHVLCPASKGFHAQSLQISRSHRDAATLSTQEENAFFDTREHQNPVYKIRYFTHFCDFKLILSLQVLSKQLINLMIRKHIVYINCLLTARQYRLLFSTVESHRRVTARPVCSTPHKPQGRFRNP